MTKVKLFIENFLIYGIGGIISKIIPLLMIPVITRLMPDTSYFGISDLSNTIVSLFSAVAMMGMYDAMYRLFFEQENESYKKTVCSTTLFFTATVSILIFIIMILFQKKLAIWFFKDAQYSHVVCISAFATLVSATNGIISAPTRMRNQRKIYLITNVVGSVLGYAIAVPLLLRGYYIIALPVGLASSGFILEAVFGVLNHSWFDLKMADRKLLKPLLKLALPLVPNFLIYWIFNSCDKLMITNIVGLDATGIYSASAKVGQISQLIYTAFAGGWQYFAFSTMKEGDQVDTNSRIFEYLGVISFSVTMLLCTFSHLIFKIVFPEQYLEGYIIAPYLFLAPLMQMLYQVIGNQFMVIKKTWPTLLILSSGAVFNVIANAKLIPIWGIEGAAIATLGGYLIAVIVCASVLLRMKLLILHGRMVLASVFMLFFLLVWRLFIRDNFWLGGILALGIIVIYSILYKNELIYIIKAIMSLQNSGHQRR